MTWLKKYWFPLLLAVAAVLAVVVLGGRFFETTDRVLAQTDAGEELFRCDYGENGTFTLCYDEETGVVTVLDVNVFDRLLLWKTVVGRAAYDLITQTGAAVQTLDGAHSVWRYQVDFSFSRTYATIEDGISGTETLTVLFSPVPFEELDALVISGEFLYETELKGVYIAVCME